MRAEAAAARRNVAPRRAPHQQRARDRVDEILAVTARLMERAGPDNLTTNHVAAELGVSVGTLYHYFPNKHAILYEMGRRWLSEWQRAFDRIEASAEEATSLPRFIDHAVDRMLAVYRGQRGVSHLVPALFMIPELRELDTRGDELAVERLSKVFGRLCHTRNDAEQKRRTRVVLKLMNSLMLEAVKQRGSAQRKTLADLKALIESELTRPRRR